MLYCSAFQLLVHGGSSGGAQSYLGNYCFFHYSILKMLIALRCFKCFEKRTFLKYFCS